MKKTNYNVPALRMALRMIEILSDARETMGVSELSRAIKSNKNMTYRLLKTLEDEGWIASDESGMKYKLTLRPFAVVGKVASKVNIREVSAEPLRKLWSEIGENTYLAVLHNDKVLYLEHLEGMGNVRISGMLGGQYPLHCTAPGKVLLAWSGDETINRVLSTGMMKFTENTISEKNKLLEELEKIRKAGWAVDNEEFGRGLLCFAAPVFNRDGIVGAIGSSVVSINFTLDKLISQIGAKVIETAELISAGLGNATPHARRKTSTVPELNVKNNHSARINDSSPAPKGLSPRLSALRQRIISERNSGGKHKLLNTEECRAFAEIAIDSYSKTEKLDAVTRRAAFLANFAKKYPAIIRDDELLAGSQRFDGGGCSSFIDADKGKYFLSGHGHIAVNYGRLLSRGISGLRKMTDCSPSKDSKKKRNKEAFLSTLNSFSVFIERHSEMAAELSKNEENPARKRELAEIAGVCANIVKNPPASYHEAIQLLSFAQIFLRAEAGGAAAISFGRFDKYMYPFYKRDIARGVLNKQKAFELTAAFWLKCCDGDESQNLVLGGVDENGRNTENELSLICLEVTRRLKVWQPSVSVRLHDSSTREFVQKAIELCAEGFGMPSFFNDRIVIDSLTQLGVPPKRARDYAIVGCYEAAPQGDSYPLTVASSISLPEVLLEFIGKEPKADTFEKLLRSFEKDFLSYYSGRCSEFNAQWKTMSEKNPCPFESILVDGCIESGLTAEEGGGKLNFFGVNILGLGNLVDSLFAIKNLVFETSTLSLCDFRRQLQDNFSDTNFWLRCRNMQGKFGSDSDGTNRLAEELSSFIAKTVLNSKLDNGVRPYPGFFAFGQDIHRQTPATPDGRKNGERLSYGCGPGVLAKNPSLTSILSSASHVAHKLAACGNPLTISLDTRDVSGKKGLDKISQIVQAYFELGGFHLHINIVNPKILRDALFNPSEYPDLMVRISGYSAQFTSIDRKWQEAIIERTERGI